MQLYALDADTTLAQALASQMGEALCPHENRAFEDGEHKLRPLISPRGADVYVLHSLFGDHQHSPHDKLCQLLMFIATLRDHGAARVSAVVPYLAYARKDRQTKAFDPLNLRYVAQLIEAVGTEQVIVLEAHNVAAFQNAFRGPALHLSAHAAFDALAARWLDQTPLVMASPDPGGVKRAQLWRESLQSRVNQAVGFAMVDKRRSAGVVSSDHLVAGDVTGATVLLLDDLVASGETLRRAAVALRQAGAKSVVACAAHGLFTGNASEVLADAAIDQLVVTDSVPTFRLPPESAVQHKLVVTSVAPLLADAIRTCHGA